MSNYLNYIIMVQQNVSTEKAKLLKKARRAFILSYWFGRYFPEEYLCMAVNLECCSEHGLKGYLMDHGLTKESELLLGDNCLTGKLNIQLLLDYIKQYGVCDDVLIKAATAEETNVLMEYINLWPHRQWKRSLLPRPLQSRRPLSRIFQSPPRPQTKSFRHRPTSRR